METTAATTAAAPSLNDIAVREHNKVVASQTADELAFLESRIIAARAKGFLEIASAYEGLAQALRSGQLTLSRYLTSSVWQSVFGARALN